MAISNKSRLLGHASVQTTERYLGTQQNLALAVNDAIGLEMECATKLRANAPKG
jgi:hypothetical protein